MSEAEVLDFLRVRFNRVDEKLDGVLVGMRDLKHRVTAIEIQLGQFVATEQSHYAAAMARFDQIETRLDRIERRLDLVEEPAVREAN